MQSSLRRQADESGEKRSRAATSLLNRIDCHIEIRTVTELGLDGTRSDDLENLEDGEVERR